MSAIAVEEDLATHGQAHALMGRKSAADPSISARTQMPGEFLTFRLGDEEYGIDILRVQEIRSWEQPTRIASAPDYVGGVINLRGVIVPVVDLRIKLGMEAVEYTQTTAVIVLNVSGRVVGAVVDSVSEVVALANDDVKAAPALNTGIGPDVITGIGAVRADNHEKMLILMDIEALLSGAIF